MSSLSADYLVYVALALPLVGGATWSLHRHAAPLLFDLVDADEMVVAAIHRLTVAGHVLLAAAAAVYLAPSAAHARVAPTSAVLSSLGGLLALLAVLHLGVLALFFWAKNRRTERAFGPPVRVAPRWVPPPGWPVRIPGATPPTVPMPPPVFHTPRGVVPPGVPAPPPVGPALTFPPPTGARLAPPYPPPHPPPWCSAVPAPLDPWAPPRR